MNEKLPKPKPKIGDRYTISESRGIAEIVGIIGNGNRHVKVRWADGTERKMNVGSLLEKTPANVTTIPLSRDTAYDYNTPVGEERRTAERDFRIMKSRGEHPEGGIDMDEK